MHILAVLAHGSGVARYGWQCKALKHQAEILTTCAHHCTGVAQQGVRVHETLLQHDVNTGVITHVTILLSSSLGQTSPLAVQCFPPPEPRIELQCLAQTSRAHCHDAAQLLGWR